MYFLAAPTPGITDMFCGEILGQSANEDGMHGVHACLNKNIFLRTNHHHHHKNNEPRF